MKNRSKIQWVVIALAFLTIMALPIAAGATCPGNTVPSGSKLVGKWTVNTINYPRISGNGTEVVHNDEIEICDTQSADKIRVKFPRDLLPGHRNFTVPFEAGKPETVIQTLKYSNGELRLFLFAKENSPTPPNYKMFGMFLFQPTSGSGDSGGTWGGGR